MYRSTNRNEPESLKKPAVIIGAISGYEWKRAFNVALTKEEKTSREV